MDAIFNIFIFIMNLAVALVVIAFSVIWMPFMLVARSVNFLWRKLLGMDT